jgi:hypothetical protein
VRLPVGSRGGSQKNAPANSEAASSCRTKVPFSRASHIFDTLSTSALHRIPIAKWKHEWGDASAPIQAAQSAGGPQYITAIVIGVITTMWEILFMPCSCRWRVRSARSRKKQAILREHSEKPV